jgi:predicted dienelactone hydrolase
MAGGRAVIHPARRYAQHREGFAMRAADLTEGETTVRRRHVATLAFEAVMALTLSLREADAATARRDARGEGGSPASRSRRKSGPWVGMLTVLLVSAASRGVAATPERLEQRCHAAAGRAGAKCLRRYVAAVRRCRDAADPTCENEIRSADGVLAQIVADVQAPIEEACTDESVARLNLTLGVERYARYIADGCRKWGDQFFEVAYAGDVAALSPAALACQHAVGERLSRLRDKIVVASGVCNTVEFAGRRCNRSERDRKIAAALALARRRIVEHCGATFDELGLAGSSDGATLDARVDAVLDRVVVPARHYALRVFPRLNMGPTANFGAAPVGVRTLELADPSRENRAGTGPRTLTVEVYYPSTAAAVAGVPRDVVKVFGIELFPTPTYRDVARATGAFPLILYSHGSGGIRFENLALAVHLASHGYVVAAADVPGDTLLDPGDDMTAVLTNRPKDISFLTDEFLGFNAEAGDFFAGAVDGDRIGVTGWSYGGYTALALAAGSFSLGTFTDPRVKAILPLDGSVQVFDPDVPALYSTITVPTLLLGASLTEVIAPRLQQMFDGLSSGPSVVGYGSFLRAAHSSFADMCEVPEVLRGRPAACEPEFLPWRHVRHVESYLALNFFDATLGGSAEALARLDPAVLADVEELAYQRK